MSAASYLAGTLDFALIVGPALAAAWITTRRSFSYLGGAEAALAFALVATAALLAVVVVTGALGVLGRVSAVIAAFALLGLARAAPLSQEAADEKRSSRGGPILWGLAAAAVAIVLVYAVAFLVDRRTDAIVGIDVLNFGLPGVARWIQQGQIWSVGHFSVYWSFGTYPNNGEAVQTLALMPWHSDAFVRFSFVPYLAMTGLASYALGMRLGAPRPTALAWAAATLSMPACMLSAVEDTKPDTFMLACFLAGLVFLVRHRRTRATTDLVLAGLGLGLAFGSRWYGVTAVAAVVAIWLAARAVAHTAWRSLVADAARVIGLIAAAGGFWLLRNLIVVGNPVYPVKVGLLGNIVFDAPPDVIRERGGFAILHYATDTHVWRTFLWPAVRDGFALPGIVALAACVVAIVAAFGGRRRPRTVLVAVTGLAGLVLLAVYAATPYSAQGPDGLPVQALVNTRYGLPAVATGAAVAAALGARGRRWALASTTLALIATVDALARIDNVAPIVAHAVRPVRVAEALVLLALVAGAVFAVRLTPRSLRFVPLAFAALVLVAGGYFHQRYYSDHRYIGRDPAIDAALQLPGRHTIAITGPTPQGILPPNLPLNGPRLDNRVRVLGRPDRHLLLPLRTRADLAAALHGEPYDLLYVLKYRGRSSPAAGWALALGWHQVAAGETSVLFQR